MLYISSTIDSIKISILWRKRIESSNLQIFCMDQFRWNFQYVYKFIKLLYSNFIQIKKSYLYFLRDFDFPKFFYTSSKIKLFLLTFQKIPVIELRFFKKLSLASKPTVPILFEAVAFQKSHFSHSSDQLLLKFFIFYTIEKITIFYISVWSISWCLAAKE